FVSRHRPDVADDLKIATPFAVLFILEPDKVAAQLPTAVRYFHCPATGVIDPDADRARCGNSTSPGNEADSQGTNNTRNCRHHDGSCAERREIVGSLSLTRLRLALPGEGHPTARSHACALNEKTERLFDQMYRPLRNKAEP